MRRKVFWLVWCEGGGSPSYKHDTKGDAQREAERLARENPSYAFAVCECVGVVRKSDITWDVMTDEDDIEGIPF